MESNVWWAGKWRLGRYREGRIVVLADGGVIPQVKTLDGEGAEVWALAAEKDHCDIMLAAIKAKSGGK